METNFQSLLKLTESVMLYSHLILCCPIQFLPSIFPSIRVSSNESVLCIRWQKYCNLSSSICPSNEFLGLISFRIGSFDLLAVQWKQFSPTPQFKSINSLVLSFIYSPTLTSIYDYWKYQGFDYMEFVDKVMSLFFNMLSSFATAFPPRSKCLLISWLQSPSAVILELRNIKSVTVSIVSLFVIKWWDQMPWS